MEQTLLEALLIASTLLSWFGLMVLLMVILCVFALLIYNAGRAAYLLIKLAGLNKKLKSNEEEKKKQRDSIKQAMTITIGAKYKNVAIFVSVISTACMIVGMLSILVLYSIVV